MPPHRLASSMLRHTTTTLTSRPSTLLTTLPIRHLSSSRAHLADDPFAQPSHPTARPSTNRPPNSKPLDPSSLLSSLPASSLDFARGSRPRAKPLPTDLASLLRDAARDAPPSPPGALSSYNASRPAADRATLSTTPVDLADLAFFNAAGGARGSSVFTNARARAVDPLAASPVPLGPRVGKTIQVDAARGIDVARAFQTMESVTVRNRVKKQARDQRFHERPGLKRKRLAKERYRRWFKESFRGICRRVEELRKQGW